WRKYVAGLAELYRGRRDVMVASLAEHFPPQATWTEPDGGLFIWATLPDYIDTTDLLARALEEHVAFVPGRAAFVDGRGGSSMRLNFSGADEDEIREVVRRIGEVVREQVALYGTLTGVSQPPRRERSRPPAERPAAEPLTSDNATAHRTPADPELAKILKLPAQRSRAG
ncbi:MAG: aminotransferase class I/II-fold pyridoxal phosphate-dependent enzyme, partial [Solirubrobacteraceae bacterium]